MAEIAVIGAGAWGTALAMLGARAGHGVRLWARDAARAAQMERLRENAAYLPGITLEPAIRVSADPAATLDGAEAVLLAVPVQNLRAIALRLRPLWPRHRPAVICAKGVEAASGLFPAELLATLLPGVEAAVLTGPNFAHEIARGLPAAAVLAASDIATRSALMPLLSAPAFRLYGSGDLIGAQAGGAAKNVLAIAAGVVSGQALGENARAALITRGLAELSRLVLALGGRPETPVGLSGLGDLVLTCTGEGSRNVSLGRRLGEGRSLPDALAMARGVVEGVATAPALVARARAAGVEMPIAEAVAALLAGKASVAALIAGLLSRPQKAEETG
ncbi:MAG: NAD(P)-dependent glycerol-3-phosphate dehydrogenase [Alphaproteobacteria bacterium]|nr:NAD(P)-dependent glycerol-3-phosphate dehydrogenase [Alphaproteobacteria bacterium]